MKTQIVTETVSLTSIHEIKHFEIRIPDNTNKIIGIEFGVRFHEAVDLGNTTLYDEEFIEQFRIADVRLQGATGQTWFYAESIKESLKPDIDLDFYTENSEMNIPFEFHGKRDKEVLNIYPRTTRIKGFIKDCICGVLEQAIHYSVTICLHVEINQ